MATWYDAAASDRYEFADEHAIRRRVSFSEETDLGSISESMSVLLRIDIQASPLARIVDPWLEVEWAGRSVRHYFNPRACGTRYLDVSDLFPADAAPRSVLQVRPRLLHCASHGELLIFANEKISGRVLVLAAHPDDAEIAAYGLYKQTDSAVVTVTAGEAGGANYGHIVPNPVEMHTLKGQLRLWDSLTIPLLAGLSVERTANLGYFDETLEQMHASPDATVMSRACGAASLVERRKSFGSLLLRDGATPSWRSLVDDLVHMLRTFEPSVIAAPHPLLDAHPDHRFTSFALFDAIEQAGQRHGRLFLYSNHPVYCAHAPFGPPGYPAALQPWPKQVARLAGFYSHPLTTQDQVEKLFALEAMHDLRRAPPALGQSRYWGLLSAVWEARDAFLRRHLGPFNYLRKAVRSREIFFVYPMNAAAELRRYVDAPASAWQ